ncbi:MAG: hypothetical protein HYY28_12145 [Betaproteobacteria bacterium]|nr:hypothetical protein [Betaproteobacteria bacterium]
MAGELRPQWRLPLLALAFASLFFGIGAGLARLGWQVPGTGLAALHGPLMASGFFGTVISLERAVASGRRWAYLAPLASGLGALAAMLSLPSFLAPALATAGSVVMLGASVALHLRQRALFSLTMALGAGCWTTGCLLWLGGFPLHALNPWWMAFLVLTIAGERLELSRVLPPSPAARRAFALLLAAVLAGTIVSLVAYSAGTLIAGAAFAALALWLLRQDVARRTVRSSGLTRFIAVCLLSGYLWLALGGSLILAAGGLGAGGAAYDAALHAVLLGFVLSMVFGHAPIIIPALTRAAVPYSAYFYAPLVLLHGSLALRLAGDWTQLPQWRAWGGALNAVAVLAFVLGTVFALVRGLNRRSAVQGQS